MAEGQIIQGVRWLRDAAGRLVGYRNPVTDQNEDVNLAAVSSLVSEAGDFVDLSYLSGWALAAAGPGYLFHDGRTLLHDGQPLASL